MNIIFFANTLQFYASFVDFKCMCIGWVDGELIAPSEMTTSWRQV